MPLPLDGELGEEYQNLLRQQAHCQDRRDELGRKKNKTPEERRRLNELNQDVLPNLKARIYRLHLQIAGQ